jgi:single-stranded-DNA-specific exonuclease
VLTCDCGTRAHHAVDALNAAGLEVVITDHHEPSDRLPNALAVVNPKRADSHYPFRELSGVGVSFRVAEALLRAAQPRAERLLRNTMLDLVALGTVADVVPLDWREPHAWSSWDWSNCTRLSASGWRR